MPLSLTLGASVAFACRGTLAETPLLRSPGLWALLGLQALVFLPVTAYLIHRFADWSLLYLVAGTSLGEPTTLAALFPAAAIAGFVGSRRMLVAGKLLPAIGFVAGGVLVAALITWLGRSPLSVVGSTDAYRTGGQIRPIVQTALVWLLAGGGLILLVSWITTLWRLVIVTNAAVRALAQTQKSVRRPSGSGTKAPSQSRRK